MDLMQSKIEALKTLTEYAKANRMLKLEVGDIKIELHPSAFQSDKLEEPQVMELTPELLEAAKTKLQKDSDEILFWSAQ